MTAEMLGDVLRKRVHLKQSTQNKQCKRVVGPIELICCPKLDLSCLRQVFLYGSTSSVRLETEVETKEGQEVKESSTGFVSDLVESKAVFPEIKRLVLKVLKLTNIHVMELCSLLPQLEVLNLEGCALLKKGLGKALAGCRQLKELSIGCPLRSIPSDTSSDLSRGIPIMEIGDEDMLEVFRNATQLQRLHIARLSISQRLFVYVYRHARNLQCLRITLGEMLSSDESISVDDLLQESYSHPHSLSMIDVSYVNIDMQVIVNLHRLFSLKSFTLGAKTMFPNNPNQHQDRSVEWTNLLCNKPIENITIRSDVPGVVSFIERLQPETLIINAYHCSRTLSIDVIRRCISAAHSLQEFQVVHQDFGARELQLLSECHASTLRTIGIFSSKVVSPVPQFSPNAFPSLKSLILNRCGVLTTIDMVRLAFAAPGLQMLHIVVDEEATKKRMESLGELYKEHLHRELHLVESRRTVEWLVSVFYLAGMHTAECKKLKNVLLSFLNTFIEHVVPNSKLFFIEYPPCGCASISSFHSSGSSSTSSSSSSSSSTESSLPSSFSSSFSSSPTASFSTASSSSKKASRCDGIPTSFKPMAPFPMAPFPRQAMRFANRLIMQNQLEEQAPLFTSFTRLVLFLLCPNLNNIQISGMHAMSSFYIQFLRSILSNDQIKRIRTCFRHFLFDSSVPQPQDPVSLITYTVEEIVFALERVFWRNSTPESSVVLKIVRRLGLNTPSPISSSSTFPEPRYINTEQRESLVAALVPLNSSQLHDPSPNYRTRVTSSNALPTTTFCIADYQTPFFPVSVLLSREWYL